MKTGRTRSHVSTRGLEGRSSEREVMIDAYLYMISWGAGFQCMIGWGAGPCYVILQEKGFFLMNGLNKLLLLRFLMNTHNAEIQREPVHDNIDRPRWCPRGLTRSQKRRVQRLRQTEALEEEERRKAPRRGVRSEVWRVKLKADEGQQSGSSAAPINMVLMLPSEFMAPDDDDEEQDLEEAMAQLNLEPIPATF